MKKKKTLKKLIITISLLTPTLVYADQYLICGNDKRIPVIFGTIFSTLLTLIKILVPIIFIITCIISFISATMSKDAEEKTKKAQGKLIRNIIVTVFIFFLISILNFVISLATGANNNFSDCLNCIINPDSCKKVDELGNTICPGMIKDQENYDADCNPINPPEKTDYGSGETGVPDAPSGPGLTGVYTANNNANAGQLTEGSANGFKYYLYIPKQIDYSKALVVYLHGSGEIGSYLPSLDGDRSFSYQIKHGMEFNCYVLLPQTSGNWGNTTALKSLIDKIVAENGIDDKRINLVGFSMGANALPTVAANIRHYFASVSAISISSNYSSIKKEPFEDVATYFFTGGTQNHLVDTHSSLSKPYYDALNALNYNTNHKYYPGQGHGGFVEKILKDTNFNDEYNTNKNYSTFMDWILNQRRTD